VLRVILVVVYRRSCFWSLYSLIQMTNISSSDWRTRISTLLRSRSWPSTAYTWIFIIMQTQFHTYRSHFLIQTLLWVSLMLGVLYICRFHCMKQLLRVLNLWSHIHSNNSFQWLSLLSKFFLLWTWFQTIFIILRLIFYLIGQNPWSCSFLLLCYFFLLCFARDVTIVLKHWRF